MKLRAYKTTALALMALLVTRTAGYAQNTSVTVSTTTNTSVSTNFDEQDFELQIDNLGKTIKAGLKDLGKSMSLSFNGLAPKVKVDLGGLGNDFNLDINPKINVSIDNDAYNDDDIAARATKN